MERTTCTAMTCHEDVLAKHCRQLYLSQGDIVTASSHAKGNVVEDLHRPPVSDQPKYFLLNKVTGHAIDEQQLVACHSRTSAMGVRVSCTSQGKPAGPAHKEVQATCHFAVRFMFLEIWLIQQH